MSIVVCMVVQDMQLELVGVCMCICVVVDMYSLAALVDKIISAGLFWFCFIKSCITAW